MDIRDYFAGQALGALIRDGQADMKLKGIKNITSLAYQIADVMLEIRERPSLSPSVLLPDEGISVEPADTKSVNKAKKSKKGKKSDTADNAT